MRRVLVRTSVLALIVLLIAASGPTALAQDASPAAMAEHPMVGAWLLDTSSEDASNPPSICPSTHQTHSFVSDARCVEARVSPLMDGLSSSD